MSTILFACALALAIAYLVAWAFAPPQRPIARRTVQRYIAHHGGREPRT